LILATDDLSIDNRVVIDNQGGTIELLGAPLTATALHQTVGFSVLGQANYKTGDFQLSATSLDSFSRWAASDVDTPVSEVSIGEASTKTTVKSPTVWNRLSTTTTIRLQGNSVELGQIANPVWLLQKDAVLQAVSGDLVVHVDLTSNSNLSLVARSGSISMDAGVKIVSNSSVALTANRDINLTQIESESRVNLTNVAGTIQAVSSNANRTSPDVRAAEISFYGTGPVANGANAARALLVDANSLHVQGPNGVTLRSANAEGLSVFRLLNQQGLYQQVIIHGNLPEKVVIPQSVLAAASDQLRMGHSLASIRADYNSYAWTQPNVVWNTSATHSYLSEFRTKVQATHSGNWNDTLLNDLVLGSLGTVSSDLDWVL